MIKVRSLIGKTPEEIAKLVENFINKENTFASPIIYDSNTKNYVSFCYFEPKSSEKSLDNKKIALDRENIKEHKVVNPSHISIKKTPILELATPRQVFRLKQEGKYKEGMTKKEAFTLISEINNQNQEKEK